MGIIKIILDVKKRVQNFKGTVFTKRNTECLINIGLLKINFFKHVFSFTEDKQICLCMTYSMNKVYLGKEKSNNKLMTKTQT